MRWLLYQRGDLYSSALSVKKAKTEFEALQYPTKKGLARADEIISVVMRKGDDLHCSSADLSSDISELSGNARVVCSLL